MLIELRPSSRFRLKNNPNLNLQFKWPNKNAMKTNFLNKTTDIKMQLRFRNLNRPNDAVI